MNPDDVVLVALLRAPRDLDLVEREHWYRIPVRHAPRFFDGAQFVAFYQGRAFGDQKWGIYKYAQVRGHELVHRSDLLPSEDTHPRANELYYKIQLGSLVPRDPPILSKRGRRVLFLWTDWAHFSTATDWNDLYISTPERDQLWNELRSRKIDAAREVLVQEGKARYRVDFLLYCPHGRLGLLIGDMTHFDRSDGNLRVLGLSESELTGRFDRVFRRIARAARELGQDFNRQGAQA